VPLSIVANLVFDKVYTPTFGPYQNSKTLPEFPFDVQTQHVRVQTALRAAVPKFSARPTENRSVPAEVEVDLSTASVVTHISERSIEPPAPFIASLSQSIDDAVDDHPTAVATTVRVLCTNRYSSQSSSKIFVVRYSSTRSIQEDSQATRALHIDRAVIARS
jgi:hypothetical protein